MQKKVQIISDGSQDLSPELSKEKDIEVVPFYVSFDGEHYYKEIEEITVRDFISRWWIIRMCSRRHPCRLYRIFMRCLKNL